MDDTQIAIAKTAFALAGLGTGIGKIVTALTTLNATQSSKASVAINDAILALQPIPAQIQEMLDAVQNIMR